jgi:type II secretory pathway pseudopilin PulG
MTALRQRPWATPPRRDEVMAAGAGTDAIATPPRYVVPTDATPIRRTEPRMRSFLDFSSWSGLLSTLLGLVVVSLVAVGIRLVFMQTMQRRRERENRQINERLKTLIAAYKTLGGSFTGELHVDPAHLRDRRLGTAPAADTGAETPGSERRRRIRDAVEAALSDVILLGTEDQVRLAAQAANDMVAGRSVHTAELVASLRGFIRQALDLEPIPAALAIPSQGPLRVVVSGGGKKTGGDGEGKAGGGAGGGGMGGGMAVGAGAGAGIALGRDDSADERAAPSP